MQYHQLLKTNLPQFISASILFFFFSNKQKTFRTYALIKSKLKKEKNLTGIFISYSLQILESLGVGNLFESDADFSLLSDTDKLSLGAGIHKAKIDVNEKGSEAAFATALFSFRMMSDEQEVVSFKCNHPFLFLLFNKETNTILFIGIYRDPERTDSQILFFKT